jgi:hypothetical protein
VIDSPNNKYSYVTGVTTNWTGTIASTRTKTAVHPMGIFADCINAAGTLQYGYAKAKIYRLKFWTNAGWSTITFRACGAVSRASKIWSTASSSLRAV